VTCMHAFDKRYLNLLREIAISQFKLKDQSTFLGLLWSLLNPLVMLLVLLLFFSLNAGRGIPHYGIYLLLGVIHFTHFSNSTSAAMNALTSMRELTCNAIFPKEILVLGSVLANSIEFVISIAIGVLIAYCSGVRIWWTVALMPLIVLMQMLTVLWISFILSCLHVFVKDIAHIYQVFLRILFFVTPIFYTPAYLGKGVARYIVSFNPLAHLIALSRGVIVDGTPFSLTFFLVFGAVNTLAIYVTLVIFKNYEVRFAESV
jgi:ABC-type polysaccharide/polyol phosphate export permease